MNKYEHNLVKSAEINKKPPPQKKKKTIQKILETVSVSSVIHFIYEYIYSFIYLILYSFVYFTAIIIYGPALVNNYAVYSLDSFLSKGS